MRRRIVVAGSSSAALSAAVELRQRIGERHEIIMISDRAQILPRPLVTKLLFGPPRRPDATIAVAPVLEASRAVFRHEPIERFDLASNVVVTPSGVITYDHLILATGASADYDAVPGLGPERGHTEWIGTEEEVEHARRAFDRFLRDPGPIVVGAVQDARCAEASYDLLFDVAHELDRQGISMRAPLTWLANDADPGTLGLATRGLSVHATDFLMKKLGVRRQLGAIVEEIDADEICVADGRRIPFRLAVLAPPAFGAEPVRACREIVDPRGFVLVDADFRTFVHRNVFAVGPAVSPTSLTAAQHPASSSPGRGLESATRVVALAIAADVSSSRHLRVAPAGIDTPLPPLAASRRTA
ncbi:FAD-dependent oxidoreductase [Myxococcota bacterium]|nr:FAD-dependent oxidoreductase [Myxococcota bacterium]